MKLKFLVIIVAVILLSCREENKLIVDISNITEELEFIRFEKEFYNCKEGELGLLKAKFPYFFPANVEDSFWINKISDKDNQSFFREVDSIFDDFSDMKKGVSDMLKHVRYYNKEFRMPKVISLISHLDYENKIIYADSLAIVSIDMYLGKNHPAYYQFADYQTRSFNAENIKIDLASKIAQSHIPRQKVRTFTDKMIQEGKKLYLLDCYLPLEEDKLKIGYSQVKMDWINANQSFVWTYFIEKQLLFSTDNSLNKRFLEEAPFSKFFMETDNKTPGRVGQWVGWQIVRSYMKNNDVSLQEMLQKQGNEIFKKSKYKPKK